jgi:signal recognition particle subunit SEC65
MLKLKEVINTQDHGESGRVLVDTKGKKKSKVILEVAKEIRKLQSKT